MSSSPLSAATLQPPWGYVESLGSPEGWSVSSGAMFSRPVSVPVGTRSLYAQGDADVTANARKVLGRAILPTVTPGLGRDMQRRWLRQLRGIRAARPLPSMRRACWPLMGKCCATLTWQAARCAGLVASEPGGEGA